jgi:hypothetical protein
VSAADAVVVIRRVVLPWVVFDLKVREVLDHLALMAVSNHCYYVAVAGWDPDYFAAAVALVVVVLLLVVVQVWVRCFRDPWVCSSSAVDLNEV